MRNFPIIENIKLKNIHSFFKMVCSDTFEFSGETHNFWEMMYVIKGSLCVSADERIYQLSEGQIIFHKPMELHKFYITDKKGAEILVFSCDAEGSLCSFFEEKVFTLSSMQQGLLRDLIGYAEKYAENTDDVYGRYLSACNTEETYSQTVSLYIKRLMLSLFENGNVLPVLNTNDSTAFTRAVRYMNDNISLNLSVDEIADYMNLSVSSLKRIFSRYAGMGVHKYFLKLKLKNAAEMLENGFSVTSVGDRLGFSSQGYFTNVFKREIGLPPSQYKKGL